MSTVQTLKANHPQLAVFQKMAREMTGHNPLAKPLKRIVAVGAAYNPERGFSARDLRWFTHLFMFCAEHDLAIDPNFEIVPLNLRDGQDFLNADFRKSNDISADILMACYIPNATAAARGSSPSNDPWWHAVSPHHTEPDAWRVAARETGARLIVNYVNNPDSELSIRDFKSANYIEGPVQNMNIDHMEIRPWYWSFQTLLRRDWKEGLARAGIGL